MPSRIIKPAGKGSKGSKPGSKRKLLDRVKKKQKQDSKPKPKLKQLKLKGWLKTPQDWARFDAWAKKNAQPRKFPEPEPMIKPWVNFLSLPPYKNLMHRKDELAEDWKTKLVEERERRGKEALDEQMQKRSGGKWKPSDKDQGAGDADEGEEKRRKREERRKRRENAWRYQPPSQKEEPFGGVSESALKTEASPRVVELAKAKSRKDKSTKRAPFAVKPSALTISATPRVTELAKPKMPRDPVEKWKPSEKDKYGRPIRKKPRYGKRLPKPEPYKPRDCPEEKDKKKEEKKEKEEQIDRIAYEPTVDPVTYPRQAKFQQKERKKLLNKRVKEKGGQK